MTRLDYVVRFIGFTHRRLKKAFIVYGGARALMPSSHEKEVSSNASASFVCLGTTREYQTLRVKVAN